MKPTIRKAKNIRGRITHYVASIGPVEADGTAPKAATETCEREVTAALARLDAAPICYRWRGHVILVAPTLDGWTYWHDAMSDGFRAFTRGTREDAEDAALTGAFQQAWSHDSDDAAMLASVPPSLRADLARWIGFQRAFKRHAAEGKSDHECHRLASEKPDTIAYDKEARVA